MLAKDCRAEAAAEQIETSVVSKKPPRSASNGTLSWANILAKLSACSGATGADHHVAHSTTRCVLVAVPNRNAFSFKSRNRRASNALPFQRWKGREIVRPAESSPALLVVKFFPAGQPEQHLERGPGSTAADNALRSSRAKTQSRPFS